ncbi:Binding-protein-dependent transport systems inner membrane component [Arthrobacter sp. 9AX]|uniref:carbohydrate ABC transporter permease n=1 Tax=Arthrobacter sp. 9AX TaxID=2653131 RepID=UPI0012F29C35|nr:carbohydrate ABC transporter permease [Arthrobacter sp. 9AX]VXC14694.1 Binding-protein-dependent transport systems inner membrane component [Arthrobacter sp. 9AX]
MTTLQSPSESARKATKDQHVPASTRGRRWKPQDVDRMLPAWISRLVVIACLGAVLIPVGYMLLLSVTPDSKVALGEVGFTNLAFGNYVTMWAEAPLASGLLNTILIAGTSSLLSVLLGSLAAYPLARWKFRGQKTFLYSLIGTQTVPGTTILLPLFVIFSWIQTVVGIQFIGSYHAIILTYMTFGLPLSTWLMVNYMRTIPRELEEAAFVDGCTRVSALFRVILPLAAPAMVVAFVFAFLVGWNDVLFASVLTRSETHTLAVAVEQFANNAAGTGIPLYGQLMAAGVVSSVPVVLLYLLLQRRMVQGLSAGSMTGV